MTEEDSSNGVSRHKILPSFEDYVLHAFRLAEEKICKPVLK